MESGQKWGKTIAKTIASYELFSSMAVFFTDGLRIRVSQSASTEESVVLVQLSQLSFLIETLLGSCHFWYDFHCAQTVG